MLNIIDFQAVEPISRVNNNNPITIPQSPKKLVLATIRLRIPRRDAHKNLVELIATVGVRGITGTSQLLFKIFRDGKEIFRTQAGVESDPTSEVNYTDTFQSIESNLGQGTHTFRLTVENITPGTEAAVVGPISFSGLAIERERDRDKDHSKDHDRENS
jgi:hypothetical protein